ncbi:MAG TPA: prepilin-type N-terminal cleavage/methylation domain-containing protein [Dongiaceae bacterium]|nr:prepilin-type N-terminal cleavage/methylation domain-containing protein [Dongiaceae bacterium]
MRASERGFSLIEVLIATALFAVVAFGAFELVRQLGENARRLTARHVAYGSLERLAAQLRAEARSATAIWVSSPSAGSAHDDCVQVDFFTADAAGPAFWSYRSFPNHTASDAVPGDTLQRLAGRAPIAPCDAAQSGTVVLGDLRAPLAAGTITADVLARHRDRYLDANDSPFVAASVPATAPVALGVLDASGAPVRGGNTVVELRLETGDGSRVADLLPGVFPSGFTEVLRYTCSERCDVGHDTAGPKTLTSCAPAWQPGWSTFVRWSDYATNPDGSLTFPGGWFIAGTFVFTYSGTRADGGTDTLVKPYLATNWDTARDYAAFPPDRPSANGSQAGSFAPWDVRSEAPAAWLADFVPYLASGESGPLAAEQQRCDAVQRQGASGGFYANG